MWGRVPRYKSVYTYQTTRHRIKEDSNLYSYRRENPKSRKTKSFKIVILHLGS
jgi:hypothetical protein